MESAQQDTGGTNRCHCKSGKRFSERMRHRMVCENLINALKLLAHQQKDGGSPIQSIVKGPCERSRKYFEKPEKTSLKLTITVLCGRGHKVF